MEKYIFIIIFLFLFTSCEKEANIDLKEMPPTPVVEGCISTDSKESYLKISMTKGFYRDHLEYDFIDNAEVNLSNNNGHHISFYFDTDKNQYVSHENAQPNTEYHLDIKFDKYEIKGNESVLSIPIIKSVNVFSTVNEYGFTGSQYEIEIEDTSEAIDYYCIILGFSTNEGDYNSYANYFFNDYEKVNGKFVIQNYRSLENFQDINMSVHHIPENYYNYIMTLYEIGAAEYGQSPFNTTVMGNPESNLNTGIGFFGSSAVSYFTIQEE